MKKLRKMNRFLKKLFYKVSGFLSYLPDTSRGYLKGRMKQKRAGGRIKKTAGAVLKKMNNNTNLSAGRVVVDPSCFAVASVFSQSTLLSLGAAVLLYLLSRFVSFGN